MWSIYEIMHIWTAVLDESEKWSLPLIFQFKRLERRSLKKSGLQRDSKPWPPRYRSDALPTELWSQSIHFNLALLEMFGAVVDYWWHLLQVCLTLALRNCVCIIFQVLQQENLYDCGVFVLLFFVEFLRRKVCIATNVYALSIRMKCKCCM